VANPEAVTGLIEGPFELGAAIGEHTRDRPAGASIVRDQDSREELGGRLGRKGGQQPRHRIGGRGIAGRELPDLAHALERADVKGVQTDELARRAGLDVPGGPVPRLQQGAPRALGEQAGGPGAVMLEHQQPAPAGRQALAPEQALDRAGRDVHAQRWAR
jgi:hypothetical protein